MEHHQTTLSAPLNLFLVTGVVFQYLDYRNLLNNINLHLKTPDCCDVHRRNRDNALSELITPLAWWQSKMQAGKFCPEVPGELILEREVELLRGEMGATEA